MAFPHLILSKPAGNGVPQEIYLDTILHGHAPGAMLIVACLLHWSIIEFQQNLMCSHSG